MEFEFEGRAVAFESGQSVAAALMRAGEPSGVFCAIGVCFGCLVSVGGQTVRGCVTPAVAGEAVKRAL